jgi:hypothetical protein
VCDGSRLWTQSMGTTVLPLSRALPSAFIFTPPPASEDITTPSSLPSAFGGVRAHNTLLSGIPRPPHLLLHTAEPFCFRECTLPRSRELVWRMDARKERLGIWHWSWFRGSGYHCPDRDKFAPKQYGYRLQRFWRAHRAVEGVALPLEGQKRRQTL